MGDLPELRAVDVRARYRAGDGALVECGLDRVVAEEVSRGLPVRDFRWYKGRRHYSGWYWSSTTGRLVAYESRLELARILLADFDPAVEGIAAQPFQLTGPDGTGSRRHVPDLLLVGVDSGVTVVDVKAERKRDDPRVQAQMAWTATVAAARGWRFEEWYGAPAALLDNVRFLAGYRRRSVIDEGALARVREAAVDGGSITGIERAVGDVHPALVRPALLHLVWVGELICELDRPLGGHSMVRLGAEVPA